MGLNEFPANWKPGRRLILPEEALAKIDTLEGQSRRYLDSRSFLFGKRIRAKHRFVHLSKLYETITTLEGYQKQYIEIVSALQKDYEALKRKMAADFPDQWSALEKLYIPVEAISDRYYFLIETVAMTFPTGMTVMHRYELDRIDKNLKEAEAAKALNLAELREQAAVHRANLERMEKESRVAAQERIDQLVEEAVTSLRGMVVKIFQSIADKIRDHKSIIKSNVDSMREVILHVRDMDFLNDQAFHRQLDQVRTLLDTTLDFKDNAQATAALDKTLSDTIAFINKTTEAATAAAKQTYFARKLAI